jgi:regulator of RNase E activity RraA
MHGSDYWWAILPIPATLAERPVAVTLRATLAGGAVAEAALGRVTLVPQIERAEASPARPESGTGPLVAICMATFDPDPAMFETQIESIRAQTHRNWICLISDDGSAPGSREAIARIVEGDPRFEVSWAEANAGFYANFERALAMVPPEATHVALSDQDDRWRPDKLERLLAGLDPDARLVFSDMRITTRSGRVVADTYWGFRPVNYTDFGSEVIANTVTGAACLFEAPLLDDVLPFPPRHGAAFHDHWIGQVAMALGPVSYVDEPLYDYVQHDEAALGYLQANGAGRFSAPLSERVGVWYGRWKGRGFRLGWRVPYFKLYCRVRVATTAMRLRLGGRLAPDRLEVLDAIDDSPAGSVYVMVIENGADYAGIGGLMGTAMKFRGFAGAVIDGSVRDTPQLKRIQFPVFSRGIVPSTTIGHYRFAGKNVPVTCAGVRVNAGDIVSADEDGVVVIPKARAADVLKKAQELDNTEHSMYPFIEKFKSMREAVAKFGRI